MSQSTYANCKLTREMMIHLQKPQHLTTTFGISHDSLVFEIMNKLSVENNESYRSERHATGFFLLYQ